MKKYLYEINKNYLLITIKQLNMSFQDIIYSTYNQWQVGYTGTASLDLISNKDENYVFKDIIKDIHEQIEIELALKKGYGKNDYVNDVIFINESYDVNDCEQKLEIITTELKKNYSLGQHQVDKPRGFVDLGGIFINYTNREIAEKLQIYFPDMNIVYFSSDHRGIEYNKDDINKDYIESDENNFYYYDQTHVVGSDLKQPYTGHILIIIHENTRKTDFAQALFRFRKINRGTYLNIMMINSETSTILNNNIEIYNRLIINEKIFNDNQQNGIKYQF